MLYTSSRLEDNSKVAWYASSLLPAYNGYHHPTTHGYSTYRHSQCHMSMYQNETIPAGK